MTLVQVSDVVVRFGGVVTLGGPSFEVAPGEICGLIVVLNFGRTIADGSPAAIQRFDGRNWELVGDLIPTGA